MVRWLPPGNPRDIVMERPWGHNEYMLADLFDAVGQLGYIFQKVQTGKGKPPKPRPRPGQETPGTRYGGKGKQVLTQLEIIARLRALSDPTAGTDKLPTQDG